MRDGLAEPGDVVADKYVVERVLGSGGMGTVFAVVHRQTGKRLALKCLLPTYLNNPSVVQRFIREAQAVGRIQHRHVIDVFDQGRDGDVLFIVLPLLEGKPLSELLHDETLTLEEALVILVRAMQGVSAANALGVLHRDLKPTNIFVCMGVSGRLDDPRVLDFGISKLEGEGEGEQSLTRSGVAVGTPHYMPLEQLTGQRDLDARTDVYAMGVILYEALSGVLPHLAENVAALALRLMHTPPVHLAQRRPDLAPGLADVVMRAIARDRDERFPSMCALIDAVTPFISDSARLPVREPEGIRLRTPRDTGEPAVSEQMAGAAATTEAASPHARMAPVVAQNLPRATSESEARSQPAQGSLAPQRRGFSSRVVVSGALLVVASLSLASLTSLGGSQSPSRNLQAALAVRDASTPQAPVLAEPIRAVLQITARDGGRPAAATDASSPRARRTSLRARQLAAESRPETPAPSEATQGTEATGARVPPASAPIPTVETRAGALSPDEF